MNDNSLLKLETFGQSIWMDFIRRGMISSGQLKQLVERDGLRGVTSNPSIFEKAIAGSHDYDHAIRSLALEGRGIDEIYQALTVEDIQSVADLFRPLYDRLNGADGFVSLEVSPHLAHDTNGTIGEGRRLWAAVDRPNVMIKVPATAEGIPAIRQLTREGINVNVTLLFGLPRYREIAEAYIGGMEDRAAQGLSLDHVASVASFFLSRIDVMIDPLLVNEMRVDDPDVEIAASLRGKAAIASAKLAYQMYKKIFRGERFKRLSAQGARPQRLLWASTSTKNPEYTDVRYVEPLIGPDTINTLPMETLDAYRDHGKPRSTLTRGIKEARSCMKQFHQLGFNLDTITQQLEDEGVQKFVKAYDLLMNTLRKKREDCFKEPVDRQTLSLGTLDPSLSNLLEELEKQKVPARLWLKDPSLWQKKAGRKKGIRESLGWLHLSEKMEDNIRTVRAFVTETKASGFSQVVFLGSGGSSLPALVFQRTFKASKDGIPLTVLDTTDPSRILRVEHENPPAETLFIVATKSGMTAEPPALLDYFYSKVRAVKGSNAGENFVALTDPDTPLAKLAGARNFRRTFLNFGDVSGGYSALSFLGLLPAALMGVDIEELLVRAQRMMHACGSCIPIHENPGVVLGAVMGDMARRGRNKLTIIMPNAIGAFGIWLKQLIAESTGKDRVGIYPVIGEAVGSPSEYWDDRLFVSIRLKGQVDDALEQALTTLHNSGQPVVTIIMDDVLDLGQEFFRWEFATVIAASVLGINPFDEPNVGESDDNTKKLLEAVEKQGLLIEEAPMVAEGPLTVFTNEPAPSIHDIVRKFFAQSWKGDYCALQVYLDEDPVTERQLQSIRLRIRDRLRIATAVSYGPRYLHSIGQYHKGGPNSGLFVQLTADDQTDLPIPNRRYTFGLYRRAQALGDLRSLLKHDRRVLHIHLGSNVKLGLDALERIVDEAFHGATL